MPIPVKCPNAQCGRQYNLRDELAGKTVKCSACGQPIPVPFLAPRPSSPSVQDPLIGAKIAHYRIESLLGQGGMGKVYKAHNVNLDKSCAIKILPQEFAKQDQTAIDRFVREARSAAKVEHPNVLPVQFVGKVGQDYFIEMQYVDGGTLDGLLRNCGKIDVKQAARIIRDVASGLQAAHEKGIIHRDIKPTNVMLTREGRVLVMDFGLAKTMTARTALTQQGYILGTPLYMAPEQATGRPVDHRSDIYALGVMFYQLITGTPPYTADSPIAILFQHQSAPIPDITQVAPGTPPMIADMIRKMMAKEPNERYQSCAEIVQEINAYLASPDQPAVIVSEADLREASGHRRSVLTQAKRGAPSRVPPRPGQPVPTARKTNRLVVGGMIAAIAVAGLVVVYLVSRPKPSEPINASGAKPSPAVETPSAESAKSAEKSVWDDVSVATAATGDKIPHPLSRKTYKQTLADGTSIDVPEGMVYVPAGEFLMGRPNSGPWDGLVQKKVYLDAFLIDKYEVTNAQYLEFVKATGRRVPDHWARSGGNIPDGRDNHPVTFVSWDDAKAYCDWCGKRLPTEAEWEKAAGWDAKANRPREYPWGDRYEPKLANDGSHLGCPYDGDDEKLRKWCDEWRNSADGQRIIGLGGNTSPVGAFAGDASPFGSFDVAGNLMEWVNDWFQEDYYRAGPDRNPQGPTEDQARQAEKGQTKGKAFHVFRGGWWMANSFYLRLPYRHRLPTLLRPIGFRCAADYPWRVQQKVESGEGSPQPPVKSAWDDVYVATAATGDKIPHPLSRKTYKQPLTDGTTIDVPEGMVYVPPGEFTMGEGQSEHQVYLDAYFIGKYEVTNAEWKAFVHITGITPPQHWRNGTIPEGRENHPVVYVSWEDAQKYCAWASEQTGRDMRLPTEAQWEKAARGPKAYIYPWGNDWNPRNCNWPGTWAGKYGLSVNPNEGVPTDQWTASTKSEKYTKEFCGELGGMTMPVGSFPKDKSFYGCHDMAGNAYEWCADWFRAEYWKQKDAKRNPQGSSEDEAEKVVSDSANGTKGNARLLRGGSWYHTAYHCRAICRMRYEPSTRNDAFGFRVVVLPSREVGGSVSPVQKGAAQNGAQPARSAWDDAYVATAATGDKIPHPLSRKIYAITYEGKEIQVPEGMVFVPAGPFTMGDDNDPVASPAHEVDVKAFFMDKYEVTNAQYMEFVKATGHEPPRHVADNGGKIPEGRDNCPVSLVRWEDAVAYCQWCGKRLPTEAEWEKAARWDEARKRGNRFPWGEEKAGPSNDSLANGPWRIEFKWKSDGGGWQSWWNAYLQTEQGKRVVAAGGGATPVGTFPKGASPYGCLDMSGNVREWLADWFERYPGNQRTDSPDTSEYGQKRRVSRGGVWNTGARACSQRGSDRPGDRSPSVGFRCAADCPWKPAGQNAEGEGRKAQTNH